MKMYNKREDLRFCPKQNVYSSNNATGFSGIYVIYNSFANILYIGESRNDVYGRVKAHLREWVDEDCISEPDTFNLNFNFACVRAGNRRKDVQDVMIYRFVPPCNDTPGKNGTVEYDTYSDGTLEWANVYWN